MQTTRSRGPRRHGSASARPNKRRRFSSQRPNNRRSFHGGSQPSRGRRRVMPSFDPSQFINKNPTEYTEEVYQAQHKFKDFGIDGRMLKTLAAMNIDTPSPIQDQVIPHILEGKDVVGLAETGTGKTAAFLIPLIERKKQDVKSITLILAPTRELALQVDNELKKLAKNFRFFSTVCVGGTNIGPQIRQLGRQNQFIIGTPGRIKDLMDRGKLPTERITSVVLDEADRMLDMGFIHDMRQILGELPAGRHTLFFSATMDEKTKGLVHDFMKDPVTVSVKKKDVTDSIAQDVVRFDPETKFETLLALLSKDEFRRVIIFTEMKHQANKLGIALTQAGIKAQSIHGNKTHGQRQRSLGAFKSGNARVLVATDVAARGIHVDNVSHVINYDLPQTFEDYVHRIGRTGRGKERGEALTFVAEKKAQ
ncbi:MAG: DEAD/DEAH box helicase [Patescibacteria group bacterium]